MENEGRMDFEKIKEDSILGDSDEFIQKLIAKAQEAEPHEIEQLLLQLERFSQSPDRSIEVYTDPDLDTFCCGQVPAKKISQDGEIIDDPKSKAYLIGVPFTFIAGKAPIEFLHGEIIHEQGHAKVTNFPIINNLRKLARQDNYDPEEIMSLHNCVEDPRMERVIGGPRHEHERRLLFEKNRIHIIPNIAKGIRTAKKIGMSPTDQFKFLLKLEGLWSIYAKDLGSEKKPWSLDDVDPRVREEYEKIAPYLSQITGDDKNPAIKDNQKVELIFVEHIWPALKRLIDEFPEEDDTDDKDKSPVDGGDSSKSKGKPKRGKKSKNKPPEEDTPLDPSDPDSWPPEMQKIWKNMKKKHEDRQKMDAEKKKTEAEKNRGAKEKRDKEAHELLKSRDAFEDMELRKRYESIKGELSPIIGQLKKLFANYLPKVDDLEYEYGKKGVRFDTRKYVRRIGTGYEKPLGRRQTPESTALILQILVDVSGSMYGNQRIQNAVKACIAIGEASKDYNIKLEILANDNKNLEDDPAYVIKSFNSPYSGIEKSNIVTMENKFGGGNEDASAIRVAIPRLRKEIQKNRSKYDKTASLVIYISDSTTRSPDTKKSVDEARQFTPFEGTAITNEGDIPKEVKYHFGNDSVIPHSMEEFSSAIQLILQRNVRKLRSN